MEPLLQIQGNIFEESLSPMKKFFGEKPKKTRTPLVAGDHPENDLSDFGDQDQIKEYHTIVGQTNLSFRIGEIWHCSTCHDNVQI